MSGRTEWTKDELQKSLELCKEECKHDSKFKKLFDKNPAKAFEKFVGDDFPEDFLGVLSEEELMYVTGGNCVSQKPIANMSYEEMLKTGLL